MISEDRMRLICQSKIEIIKKYASERNIWIYGAGIGGMILSQVLQESGIEISGFIDRKAESIKEINCLPVRFIDGLLPSEDFIVVGLRGYDAEIVRLCRENGFNDNDIYYVTAGECFNKEDIIYKGCKVGRYTYGYEELLEFFPMAIRIGRFCSINGTARIWNNHPMGYVTTHPILDNPLFYAWEDQSKRKDMFFKYGKYFDNCEISDSPLRKNQPVIIENDVWIGANVVILPGVHIGNGAVIAAGAVVSHDVEPYAVVGGVPANVIKFRYSPEQIEKFQKIEWWNWNIEKIEKNIELFYQTDEFLNKFGE